MSLVDITIDFDLAQLLGSDFDARRTKAYVTTNVESGTLMDTSTGETHLGDEAVTIAADGTGSFTTWATGADGNPISWQTSLVVDYPRTGQRDRKRRVFGPWTLVAANDGDNITDLEDEQAVPAEYLTSVTTLLDGYVTDAQAAETNAEAAQAAAEAARDDAVDISGISTSDGVVEALVKNTGGAGPLTSAALSATIASHGGAAWVTGTAYKRGRVIVNPSGTVVIANVDHTAAASYATDTAKWDAYTGPFALAPDNGKRPVGKGELVLAPEDFGAIGDWNGTTGADDTAAFTVMLAELASTSFNSGSYIQLTKGKNYRVNGLTPFVGLKIRGCGDLASITCTVLDMFTLSGTLYNMAFDDVKFVASASAGHLFSMATNAAVSGLKFNRCLFYQSNPAKSVISGTDIGAFIENTFTDCQTTLSGTSHTVPAFHLISNNGGLNVNQWIRGRFTYTGNYAIWLQSSNLSNYCYDNLVQDVNFEIANGGCVNVLSGNNTRIIGCVVYDLSGATTKDLFHFGKTTGGLKGKYALVQNVQRRGGTLGGGLYDIKFDGAGSTYNTVTDCDTGTGAGFQISWGFEPGHYRGASGVTHTGDDNIHKQIFGSQVVNLPRFTTAGRPSASTAGAGAIGFDTTLNRTIVSDGTSWLVSPIRLTATATLDFPSIAAGGSQELAVTVTGATTGDAIALQAPYAIEAGLVWNGYVSASDTVKVRVSNITAAAIDPASASWKVVIIRA